MKNKKLFILFVVLFVGLAIFAIAYLPQDEAGQGFIKLSRSSNTITQLGNCDLKPDNSVWYDKIDPGKFSQTCKPQSDPNLKQSCSPSSMVASYAADSTPGDCKYRCNQDSTFNGTQCIKNEITESPDTTNPVVDNSPSENSVITESPATTSPVVENFPAENFDFYVSHIFRSTRSNYSSMGFRIEKNINFTPDTIEWTLPEATYACIFSSSEKCDYTLLNDIFVENTSENNQNFRVGYWGNGTFANNYTITMSPKSQDKTYTPVTKVVDHNYVYFLPSAVSCSFDSNGLMTCNFNQSMIPSGATDISFNWSKGTVSQDASQFQHYTDFDNNPIYTYQGPIGANAGVSFKINYTYSNIVFQDSIRINVFSQ